MEKQKGITLLGLIRQRRDYKFIDEDRADLELATCEIHVIQMGGVVKHTIFVSSRNKLMANIRITGISYSDANCHEKHNEAINYRSSRQLRMNCSQILVPSLRSEVLSRKQTQLSSLQVANCIQGALPNFRRSLP